MNKTKRALLAVAVFSILTPAAFATELSYTPQDLGGGSWVNHYRISNTTLPLPIEKFIIWFEPGLYENLSVVSSTEINDNWYQDAVQPDPVWLDYGAYRVLAGSTGILPDETASGFAVQYTYLGTAAPPDQDFDIVDPCQFTSLEAGQTQQQLWVDADAAGAPTQIGTYDQPFETINQAVDIAVDGAVIIVRPGTYNERIKYFGKAITIKSTDPQNWDIVESTIVKGSTTSCAMFVDGEQSDSVLDGLTLTRGRGRNVDYPCSYDSYWSLNGKAGGGIICQNSSPTIRNCNIIGNGYDEWGNEYNPDYGGGIALIGNCQATITNCIIANNLSGRHGGAIMIRAFVPDSAAVVIKNCSIANNDILDNWTEAHRYDVDCWGTEPVISNTIIWGDDRSLLVDNSAQITYSCIKEGYLAGGDRYGDSVLYDFTTANGNISELPKFISTADTLEQSIFANYHLKVDSPCINAGDPAFTGIATDIDGQPRIMWDRIDIGADEYAPSITVTKPAGGDIWAADSTHNIEWQSLAYTGNVNIFYSIDNGANWIPIATDTPNTGSYQWQLPAAIDSTDCIVKVTANTEPQYIEYTQSGLFTIHPSPSGAPVSSLWPTLNSDYQRSGSTDSAGPEVGCVKWQFDTAGAVNSSIAIGASGNIHIACEDGLLYTVDPCGVQLWTYDTGSVPMSCPSVGPDGSVYVGCEDGRLHAIAADGQARWTSNTDSFIYSTPAVDDSDNVYFGSADGKIYALGPDGSDLWTFTTDGPLTSGSILASPAIAPDGTVYVGGVYDSTLYALNPADGSVKWQHYFTLPAKGWFVASPVIATDGTIYAGLVNDGSVYALDPADGGIIWQNNFADSCLEAHWKFDDTPDDSSDNLRHGTLFGDAAWNTNGKYGSALELDGAGDYVQITGYKGITGSNPRMVQAWIKTSTPGGTVISWGNTNTGEKWHLKVDTSGTLKLAVANGYIIGQTDLTDNAWHHVAAVLDETAADIIDAKLYVDNKKETITDSLPMTINTAADYDVTIGAFGTSGYFQGLIDDLQIHTSCTSPDSSCFSEPAIGPDGTIYVSFDDPYLRALNPDGSVKWITRLGTVGGFTLTTDAEGKIYAASDEGSLSVVAPDGRELARFTSTDSLAYPVIAPDGTIYVSDTAGTLWAISAGTCPAQTADLHRPQDITADRTIDFADLLALIDNWLKCSDTDYEAHCNYSGAGIYLPADINRDLYINLADVALIADRWLDMD